MIKRQFVFISLLLSAASFTVGATNISVKIAVHAPYSLVDYDGPNRNKAPRRIGYLHKNLMGTYPGSLGYYAGMQLGIPVITLELPHAGIMPSKAQISNLWTDLVRWLVRNL